MHMHASVVKPNEVTCQIPGDGDLISNEQEMEERAEWAAQACAANQPISPFPVQSLLGHPVHRCLLHYSSKSLP